MPKAPMRSRPPPKPEKVLTDQEEKFCVAIACMDMIDSDAVRYAGYVVRQPHNKGWSLQRRPDIAARIKALRGGAEQRPIPLPVVEDPADDVETGTPEWIRAKHIKGFLLSEQRADTKEMRAALIELARLSGLYVEKQEITHKRDPLDGINGQHLAALAAVLSRVIEHRTIPGLTHEPQQRIIDVPSKVIEPAPVAGRSEPDHGS